MEAQQLLNPERTPVLEVEGISKSFGGQPVLEDVGLVLHPGEIHGLLGQNGSGKSTLLKILSGYHVPEPGGRVVVNGHPIPLPVRTADVRRFGLAFVHQDLGLAPSLTVVDNLCVDETALERHWRIDWVRVRARASALLTEYGLCLDLDAAVQELSPVERAMLAVVRAMDQLRRHARDVRHGILVLDETTAFLPFRQRQLLFELLRDIVSRGNAVLMVSHDIEEVLAHTDRVTVLRDGRVVDTLPTRGLTEDELVERIVGRRVVRQTTAREAVASDFVHVAIQSGGRRLELRIGKGEVVGVTGLAGSGYALLPYVIFGALPGHGRLRLGADEYPLERMTPKRAIAAGIGLVPSDRLEKGAVGSLTVEENVTLQLLDRLSWTLGLRRSVVAAEADRLVDRFMVQPPNRLTEMSRLSGGNQQKVIFAKWFAASPRLLLLDEPTLGIDVGAREQIYGLIRQAAEGGTSVLVSSTDYEQLAAICQRVYVYRDGVVAAELTGADVDKDTIAAHCYATLGER